MDTSCVHSPVARRRGQATARGLPPHSRNPKQPTAKWLRCHHFTKSPKHFHVTFWPGNKGEDMMESTFTNWRSAMIGLVLTAAVVGAGLALALA